MFLVNYIFATVIIAALTGYFTYRFVSTQKNHQDTITDIFRNIEETRRDLKDRMNNKERDLYSRIDTAEQGLIREIGQIHQMLQKH